VVRVVALLPPRLRREATRARAWLSSPHLPLHRLHIASQPDAGAALTRLLGHLPTACQEHTVVLADSLSTALRDALATGLPSTRVTVFVRREPSGPVGAVAVRVAATTAARAQLLMELPAPDTILDVSSRASAKQGALRHLFVFLRDGGTFASADAYAGAAAQDATMRATLRDLEALEVDREVPAIGPSKADDAAQAQERALAVRSFARIGDDAVVVKRGDHLRKLRDWRADAILDARLGRTWGETVVHEPSFMFHARSTVSVYGDALIDVARSAFDVPDMRVRRYDGATVAPRQLVTIGDFAAPDTFRHPHQRRLHNGRVLAYASPYVGRVQPHLPSEPTLEVGGALFHLDTEFPNHFGHITTEVLSRCWGWAHARALEPGLRPLITIGPGQREVAQFQLDLLAAVGIDMSDPVVVRAGQRLRVEHLYAATPQFENPHHTHPGLAQVWRTLAEGLRPGPSPVQNERVFVSRRHDKRACLDRREVEEFFADAGFAIVYPETYSLAEQCAIFGQARLLGGFGGSGMFGMMFAPQARVIVISGDGYGANNEELIAATNGNELHYFWGRSVHRPRHRYDHSVLNSDFTFDLDRFRPALRAAIR
jgi:capsular polysaccharide biosynthesis protein